ncbi:hypothetical protein [Cellvibrio fibrivorans]|uniref:DUF4760 domain-containing protein n=1 Tax=Cellvibrio fibrivorans TaxID=126350 RepID=A0ABU1UWS2_9GAMM|nr:hypothetical protein [Cellvibrio fibrivorans]MDR7089626.1 hypothetical protein [Cellvibrio fibrivorans]
MKSLKTYVKYLIYCALIIMGVSLLVSILIWLLSFSLWVTVLTTKEYGYAYELKDNVQTAVVSVCGAILVAFCAFFGVRSQNLSAEKRHNIDLNRSLRKDLYFEVCTSFSQRYEYLINFSNPLIAEGDREKLMNNKSEGLFKMQMVASAELIKKMLEAEEEWAKSLFDIKFNIINKPTCHLEKVIEVMERVQPYVIKVAEFNVLARRDLKEDFPDESEYMKIIETSFNGMPIFLKKLKHEVEC